MRFVRCEGCLREAPYAAPHEWITTLRRTANGVVDEQHYCSGKCIAIAHWPGGLAGPVQRVTLRRFLFVDGKTAEEIEGVKWSSGWVGLDPCDRVVDDTDYYRSWEEFGKEHPGCGVTWIDQEGSDAGN